MAKLKSFRELTVWQKAFTLVVKTYRHTSDFPSTERFGLVSQMRRSAISVVSNIAEGSARSTRKDYAHFISNSLGSCSELETQVLLSEALKFLSPEKSRELLAGLKEIAKILTVLRKRLLEPVT
ncbi:MAG: four helix bundle protein [Patescibacteria group bacterium]